MNIKYNNHLFYLSKVVVVAIGENVIFVTLIEDISTELDLLLM